MKTDTKNKILAYVKEKQEVRACELVDYLHITPSALFKQLKKLIDLGKIVKTGKAPKVYYYLPLDKSENKIDNISGTFIVRFNLFQFGGFLTVRGHAKQAILAVKEYLAKIGDWKGIIEIDFTGVKVLGPGWADEFISALKEKYKGQVILLPSDNLTVKYSLEFVRAR